MREAPERIWATEDDENHGEDRFHSTTSFKGGTEYLRADLAAERERKLVEALTAIDALDPEGIIDGCASSAIRGLVLRMGEIARVTLKELGYE